MKFILLLWFYVMRQTRAQTRCTVKYAPSSIKTLEYPNYNSYYGSFEDKCWVIVGADVTVSVDYLDVGPLTYLETNCTTDRLEIRDGKRPNSLLLATLCGKITRGVGGATFSGATNDVYIRFRSYLQSPQEGHRGFEITYHKTGTYFHGGDNIFSYIGGVLVTMVVLAFMLSFYRYHARNGGTTYRWNFFNGRHGNRRNVVEAHRDMETQVSVVHTETTFQASPTGLIAPPPSYTANPPPYGNTPLGPPPSYGMLPPAYSSLQPACALQQSRFSSQHPGYISGYPPQNPGYSSQQSGRVSQQSGLCAQQQGLGLEQHGFATQVPGIATQPQGLATQQQGLSTQQQGLTTHQQGVAPQPPEIPPLQQGHTT